MSDVDVFMVIVRGVFQFFVFLFFGFFICCIWNLLQNEKCYFLIEYEIQKLKVLDESYNQNLKEWRDKFRLRKKVSMFGLGGLVVSFVLCCVIGVCLEGGYRYRQLEVYFKEVVYIIVGGW